MGVGPFILGAHLNCRIPTPSWSGWYEHCLILRNALCEDYPSLAPAPLLLIRQQDVRVEGSHMVHNPPEDEIIRAREDDFFRELAAEGNTGLTHPLQHMIASQQKLHSIGVPRHELDPHAAAKKARMDAKKSPYEQPQVLVEFVGGANTHGSSSKPSNVLRRNILAPRKHRVGGDSVSSSATKHRQFLSKTLSAVHEQLESTTLADISGQGMVVGCSENRGIAGGEATFVPERPCSVDSPRSVRGTKASESEPVEIGDGTHL